MTMEQKNLPTNKTNVCFQFVCFQVPSGGQLDTCFPVMNPFYLLYLGLRGYIPQMQAGQQRKAERGRNNDSRYMPFACSRSRHFVEAIFVIEISHFYYFFQFISPQICCFNIIIAFFYNSLMTPSWIISTTDSSF